MSWYVLGINKFILLLVQSPEQVLGIKKFVVDIARTSSSLASIISLLLLLCISLSSASVILLLLISKLLYFIFKLVTEYYHQQCNFTQILKPHPISVIIRFFPSKHTYYYFSVGYIHLEKLYMRNINTKYISQNMTWKLVNTIHMYRSFQKQNVWGSVSWPPPLLSRQCSQRKNAWLLTLCSLGGDSRWFEFRSWVEK